MGKKYVVGCAGEFVNARFCVENEIVIGRNTQKCQIIFSSSARGVSGVHCKVHISGGNIYVTDMNSTNGTFLEDGTRLSPGIAVQLQNEQKFYLGNRQNVFGVEAVHDKEFQEQPYPVQEPQQQPQYQFQPQQPYPYMMPHPEKRKGIGAGAVIAIIVGVVILVGCIFSAQDAQRRLEEEQNKGPLEKTIDAVDSWFEQ
ncbi:MAG: FHA domain-containing protein [Lachnospiraceae bacterium]|nr:FHA domain-containing protein [Lachnospiraceae bacterium]